MECSDDSDVDEARQGSRAYLNAPPRAKRECPILCSLMLNGEWARQLRGFKMLRRKRGLRNAPSNPTIVFRNPHPLHPCLDFPSHSSLR